MMNEKNKDSINPFFDLLLISFKSHVKIVEQMDKDDISLDNQILLKIIELEK